jgi:phthiocerol/phenolphthiocerol synthesis type-I polyketide synthase E
MSIHIAVVGIDCRLPGASDVFEFWQLIKGNKSGIRQLSDKDDESYVPYKGVLDKPFHFDADFFGLSQRDALIMDPQVRLLLESCYRALDSSGYDPLHMQNKVGVFASSGFPGYLINHLLKNKELCRNNDLFFFQLFNDKDFLATRIAYHLNLQGPAMNIQAGCSSSLVGIHVACQSLLMHDCDMALAGGASISYPVDDGYTYQQGSILSRDGDICTFDERASGTVRGDGVCACVLKRLEDAVEDNDPIIAVIRGSAINNDGKRKVAFTAPSVQGQTSVIQEAFAITNLDPDSIDFIETHGTGTPLGDPVEVRSVCNAFNSKKPIVLSSLKPHIGHTDATSGIASFIKSCLCLYHKKLPHTLNFHKLNPLMEKFAKKFTILTEPQVIQKEIIRAGVSSLGMGGTNVHMILENFNYKNNQAFSEATTTITLSSHTRNALEAQREKLIRFLQSPDADDFSGVVATLQKRSCCYKYKESYNFNSFGDLVDALQKEHHQVPHSQETQKINARRRLVPAYMFDGNEYCASPDQADFTDFKSTQKSNTLLQIWQQVLGVSLIKHDDNFFDLGGDSFSAIQLINQLPEEFKEKVSVLILFEYPTFSQFENYLNNLKSFNNET